MDPEHAGTLPLFQVPGHRPVRREHELLDHPVGRVAEHHRDPGHRTLHVEQDLRIGQVEVDASLRVASTFQHLAQPVGGLQHGYQFPRHSVACLASLEHLRHLFVGQARRGANHAVGELGLAQLAARREVQDRRLDQPILAGNEGAQAVG